MIQPYYIKSIGRKSLREEISTMEQIRQELFKQHPDTERLIKPTIFIEENNIGANKGIRESFLRLQKNYNIGYQYDYMARFAQEHNIDNLEVSILSKEGPLSNVSIREDTARIDEKYSNTDVYKVYGYASFPILNTSKLEMKKLAIEFKFINLLNKSWFCHHPINGKPCGTCLSCIMVMEANMHERMPLTTKIRYYTSPKRYIKSFLKQNSEYNYRVKKFFGRVVE